MQEQSSLLERIRIYSQLTPAEKQMAPLDLSGCNLAQADLRGLDLQGVNLTGADLTQAHLEGAQLHKAILAQTCFAGIHVSTLIAAGLSPQELFSQRAGADRSTYAALHFSPVPSPSALLSLTAEECIHLCQIFDKHPWEQLTDNAVVTTLYQDTSWENWLADCRTRLILSWAVAHRDFLRQDTYFFHTYPMPSFFWIGNVEESDLVVGKETDPAQVFRAVKIRGILENSQLPKENIDYPLSPFGDTEDIVQLKTRRELQMESGYMHNDTIEKYDGQCLNAQCYIYHIGVAAPEGYTLKIFPTSNGQHICAYFEEILDTTDLMPTTQWLQSMGIEQQPTSIIGTICEKLRLLGISKVSIYIFWFEDEPGTDVEYEYTEDTNGQQIPRDTAMGDVQRRRLI